MLEEDLDAVEAIIYGSGEATAEPAIQVGSLITCRKHAISLFQWWH